MDEFLCGGEDRGHREGIERRCLPGAACIQPMLVECAGSDRPAALALRQHDRRSVRAPVRQPRAEPVRRARREQIAFAQADPIVKRSDRRQRAREAIGQRGSVIRRLDQGHRQPRQRACERDRRGQADDPGTQHGNARDRRAAGHAAIVALRRAMNAAWSGIAVAVAAT
ncbi:hypothetical protein QP164_05265 [Sphingomonas sp. LR59]